MSVLLGIGDKSLSQPLKEILIKKDYDNVEETYHIDYLAEKVSYEQPDIVIIHEHLQSNCTSKEEKQEEILSLIEHWRVAYNDSIRVVMICIRDRNDPFLGQLIAHNVLDIFPDKALPVHNLLNQLAAPPNFSNVKRLATTKLKVELVEDEDIEEVHVKVRKNGGVATQSTAVEVEEAAEVTEPEVEVTEEDTPSVAKEKPKKPKSEKEYGKKIGETAAKATSLLKNVSEKIPKIENQGESERTELFFDDLLDLLEPSTNQDEFVTASVIGTVLIGVAGVKNHLGATHTALSTARFLSKAGHSVVVVECNNSKDFDRIHTLYEGSKELLQHDTYFELAGVHHYKYRANFDLNKLYSMYEYVIMDYGDLQTATNYIQEFRRAHVRLVVCSGDEWKTHWVEQFLKVNQIEKSDCTFVIPSATKEKVKDYRSLIQYEDVYAFPTQDDPYKISRETEHLMTDLLGEYLNRQSIRVGKNINTSTVVIACIACIIVTTIIFTIFTYL